MISLHVFLIASIFIVLSIARLVPCCTAHNFESALPNHKGAIDAIVLHEVKEDVKPVYVYMYVQD